MLLRLTNNNNYNIVRFSKEHKSKSYAVNVTQENVSLNANGSPPYDPHAHRILEHPTT